MRRLVILLLASSLAACITPMPRSARPTTSAIVLETVPVERWGDNTCGSGALAAVLTHYGDPITEAELNAILPKGKHGGVVSVDLLLETRRRGFDAHLIRGSEELVVRRLEERRPSILMLQVVDMPGDDRDYYHYVVADGYDASKNLIRFQFGDGKSRWVPLAKLAGPWSGAGYATMTVDPLTLESGLKRAVLLEEKGSVDEAIEAYRMLLRRFPHSALAWTNLGNAQAKRGVAGEAEASYRKALEIAPADRDALNNLSWLLFTAGRFGEAEPLARAAVAAGGPDPHLALDTLGHVLAATGRCAEARETYGNALKSASIDEGAAASVRAAISTLEVDCVSRVGGRDPSMAPPGAFE
ncbi:MAG TPA: tetratricopeptide repeat protein [Thermoanaerobaculia bacterium]|nr:tetratricopeptide repeat protein [Thermoanaerobaculia bacterium]